MQKADLLQKADLPLYIDSKGGFLYEKETFSIPGACSCYDSICRSCRLRTGGNNTGAGKQRHGAGSSRHGKRDRSRYGSRSFPGSSSCSIP